jgi:hypothetical protein
MLYQVIKKALDTGFVARIEDIVAGLPMVKSATVEEEDYSTRECELRWIYYGTPGFDFAAGQIVSALRDAGMADSDGWEIENLQYTAYGPSAFHNWHIDAYRRSYNRYDLPLGDRFIGKKRALSISVLLNGTQCFTGGTFEISMFPNGQNTMGTALETFSEAGDMAVFDSSLCHRVAPVCTGLRKSLVVWICA